jgi:hypothetical protein
MMHASSGEVADKRIRRFPGAASLSVAKHSVAHQNAGIISPSVSVESETRPLILNRRPLPKPSRGQWGLENYTFLTLKMV